MADEILFVKSFLNDLLIFEIAVALLLLLAVLLLEVLLIEELAVVAVAAKKIKFTVRTCTIPILYVPVRT
jgi:hypothetical protein